MNWQNPFSPSGTDTTAAEQFNGREGAGSDFLIALRGFFQLVRSGFAPRQLRRWAASCNFSAS